MKKVSSDQLTKEIIAMMQQREAKNYENGQTIRRSAHTKALAILEGKLVIEGNLPSDLRKGIFAKSSTYPVWIRISNSSNKPKPDSKKDVRGLAIQLVPGGKLQDFILVSTKHMPICSVRGFHGAVSLMNGKQVVRSFIELVQDLNFLQLLKLATTMNRETSPLDNAYFSITPYRLDQYAVKYSLIPTSVYKSTKPSRLTPTYLRDNMKQHLGCNEATFDLKVQLAKPGMEIENCSQEWDEKVSSSIKVATLYIPVQVFDTEDRKRYGEKLTFSPAHTLEVHGPLGQLNSARAMIYKEMQQFRKVHGR